MRIRVYLMAVSVMASGALIGAILGIQISETTDHPAGNAVEMGDLQLVVNSVGRAKRQREDEQANLMSSGRTHGAPKDRLDRIYLRVTVKNRGDRNAFIDPQEFRLQTRYGGSRSAHGGSLTATSLRPRGTLSGVLVFDVPDTASGLQLEWTRDGRENRVPVAEDASDQGHHDHDNFDHGRDDHGRDEVTSPAVPFRRDAERGAQGS